MSIKDIVKTNLKNVPGRKIKNKYLIFECDDWGGIRMPSKEVYKKLTSAGLQLNDGRYNFDTLATSKDLTALFDSLETVRDVNGNGAVITAFTNVTNPDFEKIKASRFKVYHHEPFVDTLNKYYNTTNVFRLWQQGMKQGIFVPELHGREHISTQLWLQELRKGDKDLLIAFDNGFVSYSLPHMHPEAQGFRPEFFYDSKAQIPFLKRSIKEGVQIFRDIFGKDPGVFAPSNLIFHPDLEQDLAQTGIKYMYINRMMTVPNGIGGVTKVRCKPGDRRDSGLSYYTRNCKFEPTETGYKGIEYTLMQIGASFRWGKPAIISTHRANFVSAISPLNGATGLEELRKLLKAIVKKWPDVEFVSSRKALDSYFAD
ncbi:hypothetical protein [Saccharicrinis sp. GN24d3]|uniref:hypothetical protein n=1 Tax=Saccharicrinis sp. GN24d3 TaxID=3458416 RepID=UPI004036AF91